MNYNKEMKVFDIIEKVQSVSKIVEITIIEGHSIHFNGTYLELLAENNKSLLDRTVEAKYLIDGNRLFLFLNKNKEVRETINYEPIAHMILGERN